MNWNDPRKPPPTGRPVLLWVRTKGLDWIGRGFYRRGYRIDRFMNSGKSKDEIHGWASAIPTGSPPAAKPVNAVKMRKFLQNEDPRAISEEDLERCPLCEVYFEHWSQYELTGPSTQEQLPWE